MISSMNPLLFICIFKSYVFTSVSVCVWTTVHVEVRGRLGELGPLLPGGSQALSSGCQAWGKHLYLLSLTIISYLKFSTQGSPGWPQIHRGPSSSASSKCWD